MQNPPLLLTGSVPVPVDEGTLALVDITPGASVLEDRLEGEPDPKKKRPTPTNSENQAETAEQPCPSQ